MQRTIPSMLCAAIIAYPVQGMDIAPYLSGENKSVNVGDITTLRDNLEKDFLRLMAQSPKIVDLSAALIKERFMTTDNALTLYEPCVGTYKDCWECKDDPIFYGGDEYGSDTPPICAELLVCNYLVCAADLIVSCQLHTDRTVAWSSVRTACWEKIKTRLKAISFNNGVNFPAATQELYIKYRYWPGALRNHSDIYRISDETLPTEKMHFNPYGLARYANAPYGYVLTKLVT